MRGKQGYQFGGMNHLGRVKPTRKPYSYQFLQWNDRNANDSFLLSYFLQLDNRRNSNVKYPS